MSHSALEFIRLRKTADDEYVAARSQGFCEACGFWSKAGKVITKPHSLVCRECAERLKIERDYFCETEMRISRVEKAISDSRFLLVTAAIISDDKGRVLLAEREHSAHGEAAWEFPGGKAEDGESLAECLVREIEEELAIKITTPRPFFMVDHTYEAFDIRLCSFDTKIESGRLSLRDHCDIEWVEIPRLLEQNLSGADVDIVRAINSR